MANIRPHSNTVLSCTCPLVANMQNLVMEIASASDLLTCLPIGYSSSRGGRPVLLTGGAQLEK